MTPVESEGRQASEMRALAYNYKAAPARDTDGIFVLQFLMLFKYIFGNESCNWSTISVWKKKNQQKWIVTIGSSAMELHGGFLNSLSTGLFLSSIFPKAIYVA